MSDEQVEMSKVEKIQEEKDKAKKRWSGEIKKKVECTDRSICHDWVATLFSVFLEMGDGSTSFSFDELTEIDKVKRFIEKIGKERIKKWYPSWFSDEEFAADSDYETMSVSSSTITSSTISSSLPNTVYPSLVICETAEAVVEYNYLSGQNILSTCVDQSDFLLLPEKLEPEAKFTPYRDAPILCVKIKRMSNERAKAFQCIREKLCDNGYGHRILEPVALLPFPPTNALRDSRSGSDGGSSCMLGLFRPSACSTPLPAFLNRLRRSFGQKEGRQGQLRPHEHKLIRDGLVTKVLPSEQQRTVRGYMESQSGMSDVLIPTGR
jgi:hypothetical protein